MDRRQEKLNSCDNVFRSAVGLALLTVVILSTPVWAAGPAFVEMTWMSIANMYYRIGDVGVVTDGYITRLPQSEFYGGGGGLGVGVEGGDAEVGGEAGGLGQPAMGHALGADDQGAKAGVLAGFRAS